MNFQKVISELSDQLGEQNIEMKLREEENESKLKSITAENLKLTNTVEHLRQKVEELSNENAEQKGSSEVMQVKK